jgi:predicted transcriptional regulator
VSTFGWGKSRCAGAKLAKPAVSIRKSITPDHLICLEDGRHFKSLKRHLMKEHEMTIEQYRDRWNLPRDYPGARRAKFSQELVKLESARDHI